MNDSIKRPKFILYFGLLALILLSNFFLYRMPFMQPLPNGAVLGSIFDFMFMIPLLTYLFIIRKRFSLKYIGLVILAGYGAASFIIPNQHLQQYPFIHYIVAISEGSFVILELYIFYKVLTKLPALIREYRNIRLQNSFFQYNLRMAIDRHLINLPMFHVFLSELSIFYYSLFSWRTKVTAVSGHNFTYHKKTSTIAVYILLIHATVLESVGFHYLLHSWNVIAAYVLLFINVYGVLYFLGEIQATRLTPFYLTDHSLYLQVGLSKSIEVPLDKIKCIKQYDGPEKISRKDAKNIFDARPADFMMEKPMFEIQLFQPRMVRLMYGLKSSADRIILNVDEPNLFLKELNKAIKKKEG
ncbi:hypothetical protein HHO41_02850 [Bacillus sp. DNRA2]|uniref:hypothetical protein n=1 Tax=Bacillus sp. DNRA2 TaxID=2723053 RepID=UPI00145D9E35|nr:hypothetical protein [Bacillus sp. DNRA2]NMD69213.1 hypothetical protein [Bacillus sp. DNRA2]